MTTIRAFLLLVCALPLFSQTVTPDCTAVYTFTTSGRATTQGFPIVTTATGHECVTFRLTYQTTGFTSVTIQVEQSPDNSTWTAVTGTLCSAAPAPPCVAEGLNPLGAGTQGTNAIRVYARFITVNVTAVTGSGSGKIVVYGYKGVQALSTIEPTTFADTSQRDAFSRLRVSEPVTVFDNQFQYNLQPLLWDSVITGTGTAVNIANGSAVAMSVAANGDQVVRQTHRYFRYQPGKSQLAIMTGVMGALKVNTRQRLGYFDAQNGLFFEQDGVNVKVVQRSFTTGSAVDTAVNQSAWNLDKLNGTGPSGVTLNLADSQIFVLDLQWLGVGRVRFGFDFGGQIIYAHEFLNANSLTKVYMTTANLPLRYEITMTGATTATTMTQICQSLISEGGFEGERGLLFTANNGITTKTVTTRRPILSIRPKTTFNSITNRGLIEPQTVEAEIGSGTALVEIVYNGTLTGASFTSVDTNSLTESDTSATVISGGTTVLSFYVSGGASTARSAVSNTLGSLVGKLVALTLDPGGTVPDILSVVVTSFTGSVDATGAFGWKEIY